MHANAKRLPDQERNHISELQPVPSPDTLGALVLRFMRLLRMRLDEFCLRAAGPRLHI